MALHLDEFHHWLCTHVWTIVAGHGGRGRGGRGVVLPLGRPRPLVARLECRPLPTGGDPVQRGGHRRASTSSASPWWIGVAPPRTRRAVHSGSDNSYGVYLAQLLFITVLSWLGWRHLDNVLPWPLVSVLTVVIVFLACIGLTELLARTPWSKPLTGRSRVPWRSSPDVVEVSSAPTPRVVGARPTRAARRAGWRRSARRDRFQRVGDGVAHHPVARCRSDGCWARAGARRTSRSSAQTRATSVGTVPSPGTSTGLVSWSSNAAPTSAIRMPAWA